MKHDNIKAVEKFKIDLIVWKCRKRMLFSQVFDLFKIDLIVWKLYWGVQSMV